MEKVICSVYGTEEDLIIIDRQMDYMLNEESVFCIDCIAYETKDGIRKSKYRRQYWNDSSLSYMVNSRADYWINISNNKRSYKMNRGEMSKGEKVAAAVVLSPIWLIAVVLFPLWLIVELIIDLIIIIKGVMKWKD